MTKFYISEISKKYYENYDKDCEIKRDLNVCEIENGIILPAKEIPCNDDFAYIGGVLDSDKNFVKESSTFRDKSEKALLDGYAITEQPRYIDEIVIYGGVLYEFYGHVLLETMSRLWYYYKSNPNKYRVVFNVVPHARGKFKEFFELLDIPYDDNTFITEPTQYKNVIIPEQASIYATNWHQDFLIPFEYMKAKIKPAKYKKVYFTRTKIKKRSPVWGEKLIERIFNKNGYKVFSPERLSLRQQISIMKGCESFASLSGSANHNLLFSENNINVTILNRNFEPDFCHFIVDFSKKHKVTYIDISLSLLPVTHVNGPWIVGFTEELNKFLIENNFSFSKKIKIGKINCIYAIKFLSKWYANNKARNLTDKNTLFHQSRFKIKNTITDYIRAFFK